MGGIAKRSSGSASTLDDTNSLIAYSDYSASNSSPGSLAWGNASPTVWTFRAVRAGYLVTLQLNWNTFSAVASTFVTLGPIPSQFWPATTTAVGDIRGVATTSLAVKALQISNTGTLTFNNGTAQNTYLAGTVAVPPGLYCVTYMV